MIAIHCPSSSLSHGLSNLQTATSIVLNQAALNRRRSMLPRVLNLLDHSIFGRTVGSLSCVVGLLCYALSSSFKSLFGEWDPTKIILHIILSSIISVVFLFEVVGLFEAKSRVSFVSKLKPHVQFLVLMLTSLYSFFADRYTKGRPDTWSVISSVAFALASLCLSRQIKPGFDVGLFGFFLGRVTVQLMKIHLIFILVAAGFCYPLIVLKTYSESQSENGESSGQELKEILFDNTNRALFGMGQDEEAGQINPRRRVRNVSPSPSPLPSTLLTQDDDRRASSRSSKGGSSSSSNDPLLDPLAAHGNKSFENLPEVAATEQFLSDLQEREKQQQQQEQWEQEWELQGEQPWEQHQLQGEQQQLQHREQQQLQHRERQLQLRERQLRLRERRLQSQEPRQQEPIPQELTERLQRQWRLQREQQRELRRLSGSSGSPATAAVGAAATALCV